MEVVRGSCDNHNICCCHLRSIRDCDVEQDQVDTFVAVAVVAAVAAVVVAAAAAAGSMDQACSFFAVAVVLAAADFDGDERDATHLVSVAVAERAFEVQAWACGAECFVDCHSN
jgi:hypothetical protein